jgi:hypothetical protein
MNEGRKKYMKEGRKGEERKEYRKEGRNTWKCFGRVSSICSPNESSHMASTNTFVKRIYIYEYIWI